MRTTRVTCDGCQRDLTETGNSVDYRLVLAPEAVPCSGGFQTMVMRWPPLDRSYHFCRVACLQRWLAEDYPKVQLPGLVQVLPHTNLSPQEGRP